jgi:hypothetical protein
LAEKFNVSATYGRNNMRHLMTTALLTMALIAGQAIAQGQATAVDTARAKLSFLVGDFATETNIPPIPSAPKGVTGKGTSVITWALDSMFLLIEEQSTNPLFGQYKGHGVLGFDRQTHEFALSMFNNFGDHLSYKGNFVGDTLVLETKVPMPGRPFDQRLVWYKDGESVKLRVLNDLGKGFTLALEETAVPVSRSTR